MSIYEDEECIFKNVCDCFLLCSKCPNLNLESECTCSKYLEQKNQKKERY